MEEDTTSLESAFESEQEVYSKHRVNFILLPQYDPADYPVIWDEVDLPEQKKFLAWLSEEMDEKQVFMGMTEARLNQIVTSEDQGPASELFESDGFEKPDTDKMSEEGAKQALIDSFGGIFRKNGIVFTSSPMDEEPIFCYNIEDVHKWLPGYEHQDWYTLIPKKEDKKGSVKIVEKTESIYDFLKRKIEAASTVEEKGELLHEIGNAFDREEITKEQWNSLDEMRRSIKTKDSEVTISEDCEYQFCVTKREKRALLHLIIEQIRRTPTGEGNPDDQKLLDSIFDKVSESNPIRK